MKTISIVYPAYPISDQDEQKGIEKLKLLGYKVKSFKPEKRYWVFSGTDKDRGKKFTDAFLDPDSDFVLGGAGGYGSARMANYVDWKIVQDSAKPFMAYSDVTYILNFMAYSLGMDKVFHGPMLLNLLKRKEVEANAIHAFDTIIKKDALPPANSLLQKGVSIISKGEASGKIIGGNTTLMQSLLNTHHNIDLEGKILMLEDIDEADFRIDRMLRHFVYAERFKNISGILMGDFSNMQQIGNSRAISFDNMLQDIFSDAPYPVVRGLNIGHGSYNIPIRIGQKIKLIANNQSQIQITYL